MSFFAGDRLQRARARFGDEGLGGNYEEYHRDLKEFRERSAASSTSLEVPMATSTPLRNSSTRFYADGGQFDDPPMQQQQQRATPERQGGAQRTTSPRGKFN